MADRGMSRAENDDRPMKAAAGSPVEEALNRLARSAALNQDVAGHLLERLGPVLHPERPTAVDPGRDADVPDVQLVLRIEDSITRMDRTRRQIEDALDRLAI